MELEDFSFNRFDSIVFICKLIMLISNSQQAINIW